MTFLALLINLATSGQGSYNVSLVYQWNDTSLPSSSAHDNRYNEIWGVAQGGREYAIIGSTMGTHIFDITNPADVDTAVFIPGAATGPGIVHRDYHDYAGYLYIVCDEDSGLSLSTLQIVDLSNLPDSAPVVYNSNALFRKSHNIFIDTATARLYACGVRPSFNRQEIYSLADPINPVLIETYNRGRHDVYVRNDTAYLNDGTAGLYIVDFQTPGNAQDLGNFVSVDTGYNHSGWLSEDGDVYVLAEETFGVKIRLLDVSDLSDITVLSTISSLVNPLSIAHNLIIKENFLYVSYYNDGLYIFDISDASNPFVVGYYDTSTEPHLDGKYRGAWGVYSLLPSGRVLISDMQNGLFVLDVDAAVSIDKVEMPANKHTQVFPNPFSEHLMVTCSSENNLEIGIEIFNELGQLVSTSNAPLNNGRISVNTSELPRGFYEVTLKSMLFSETHKLIKIK